MDPKKILKKIIDDNGSCNWVTKIDPGFDRVCDNCPLSTSNGGKCGEITNTSLENNKSAEETNKIYKKIAEETLLSLEIESLLNGEYDEN